MNLFEKLKEEYERKGLFRDLIKIKNEKVAFLLKEYQSLVLKDENESSDMKRKTIKQLKSMKNSLVKNIALAKRMGTSKPKSKSTISKKEFDKLKTYKKK